MASTAQADTPVAPTPAPKEKEKKPAKPREYNPRFKGYIYIMLSSLVNFSAISNIKQDGPYDGIWGFCLSFGTLTFAASMLILLCDRTKCCTNTFDYTKALDGKFEGYTLFFFSLWWIVGIAYITQVNGIAYLALNIYFSSWLTLVSCIYTLNKWSSSKDILSIAELTGVSATLNSWYVVMLSSLFVMGTCIDLFSKLEDQAQGHAYMGFALGVSSAILSCGFILVHYKFIELCTEGGWVELCCSFLLILMWIVGVAVLTQNEGIGATLTGTGCQNNAPNALQIYESDNCTISVTVNGTTAVYECSEVVEEQIPGSNLYVATWVCLGSALNITFRWKAAQALQFAQAQNQRAMTTTTQSGDGGEAGNVDDDDDDMDEFEDASLY